METFAREFEKKVKKTIEDYSLIEKNDKVVVACSGGKDSTTTLYLLNKFGYKVEGLMIDLLIGSWSDRHLQNTKKFCDDNGVKLHVVNIRDDFGGSIRCVRSAVQSKIKVNNCSVCGVIKRWLLNREARKLGATKIATGHNLDDISESLMMNLFLASPNLNIGLGPKTMAVEDKKLVPRIKPLYFCLNAEVERYSRHMGFPVIYSPCPCSYHAYRTDARRFLKQAEKLVPGATYNIVESFLRLLPNLQELYPAKGELRYCDTCGEPTRRKICKTCEFMELARK